MLSLLIGDQMLKINEGNKVSALTSRSQLAAQHVKLMDIYLE